MADGKRLYDKGYQRCYDREEEADPYRCPRFPLGLARRDNRLNHDYSKTYLL